MELSNQELTKLQPQGHPKLPDDQILGLGRNGKRKNIEPSITYQLAENPDLILLDRAFDILFEETLKKNGNLTSYDNLV
jgi:hypothetical protein